MRKLFLILFLAFPLLYPLAAQTEEVNEQYELFSWEPVARAKQYGVTVEKYDASTDTWSEYKSVKTTETQLEILFTPGTFRVSISTYNLMGRKGKSSDWVTFKILEEHIPYLNERFLAKDKKWNAPVLNLDEANEQTLLIKGRNIFSPRTEFYLIPIEQNTEGGKQFINYGDDRKEQKLNVVQRNSKEYSVVVSYDSTKLK